MMVKNIIVSRLDLEYEKINPRNDRAFPIIDTKKNFSRNNVNEETLTKNKAKETKRVNKNGVIS